MIQFLVSAVFIVLGVFILVVLVSLMVFIVLKLLRVLFPSRFGTLSVTLPKKKKTAQKKGGQMEDRCASCGNFGKCPAALSGNVHYPCAMYSVVQTTSPASGCEI